MEIAQTSFKEVNFYSDLRLHGRYFAAQGSSKGNFLLLHGLTSNSAWFGKIAEVLARAGYNVLVYDRRGSGLSAGLRGDAANKEIFFDDLKAAANFIWKQSAQPLHIMSFSYWWKLSPIFVQKLERESYKVDSLIFVAPASDLSREVTPRLQDLLKIFFNWKGPYFSSPIRDTHLTQEAKTLDWIQHSQESLPQHQFTRRFFLYSKALDREASALLPQLKKPMLTLLPKGDRVLDRQRVKERFSRGPSGFPRKVLEIEGNHIVDTSEAQQELVEKVLGWLRPSAETLGIAGKFS